MSQANEYDAKRSLQQKVEFRNATQAVANYIKKYHDLETIVIVEAGKATILQGQERIIFDVGN